MTRLDVIWRRKNPNATNVGHCQGQRQYTNLYFIEMKPLRPQDGSECASSEHPPLEDPHCTDGESPMYKKSPT